MGILINQGRQIGGLSEQDQANIGKVTQTETTTGAEYELLFSETAADATTHTEEARKSQYFKFNPHNKIFTVGTRKTTEPDNYTPIVTPGDYSTCLGYNVATEGDYCFSEGQNTFSAGTAAHAEGRYTHAGGNGAHAEGCYTIAWGDYQHVQGKYNVKDTNLIYAHIVGNGTGSNARSNAYALRWDGQQDVTNDIVRVDSGGTWDGVHASLEDALTDKISAIRSNNLGECNSDNPDEPIFPYDWYDIATFEVPVSDSTELQKPILFELSTITAGSSGNEEGGNYDILKITFGYNSSGPNTFLKVFECDGHNSDGYIMYKTQTITKDNQDYDIWTLTGKYEYYWKAILHRVYGAGADDFINEIIMENNTSYGDEGPSGAIRPTRMYVRRAGDTMSGQLNFSNNNVANIVVPARALDYINSSGDAGIYAKKDLNVNQWYPVVCMDTKSGGHWQIGNYNNDNLQFVFGTKANRDAHNNKVSIFNLVPGNPDTTYIIAHSGNVSTGDSNGQVKIAGTNVSVKGLAAAAYKGVFTRSSTGDIGWGTTANRTKVVEASAIAFWNGCHSGTSSNLQYCDRGRFGTIVTKNTGDYLPINPSSIEFTNNTWHFLDFHWQGSTDDFTARIIEEAKGTFRIYYRLKVNENYMVLNQYGGYRMYHGGNDLVCQMRSGGTGVIEFLQTGGYGTWATCKAKAFSVQSSKWIKENINDLTEEEALKLLNLRPVTFDYTDGVTKNCRGLIAEEAYEELPYCVDMPEEYLNLDHDPILEAENDADTDIGILPSIDYSKFVPHLIKLCQIQQKQIDELTERLDNLNKN